MKLADAQKIVSVALAYSREQNFKPMAVAVLDARGALTALAAEDGVSLRRADIAIGKANGSIGLGMGSRALAKRAETNPYFVVGVMNTVKGALIPVPGGVLIKDGDEVIGAVGISGDISDNDEAAALAGIQAAGFEGETG